MLNNTCRRARTTASASAWTACGRAWRTGARRACACWARSPSPARPTSSPAASAGRSRCRCCRRTTLACTWSWSLFRISTLPSQGVRSRVCARAADAAGAAVGPLWAVRGAGARVALMLQGCRFRVCVRAADAAGAAVGPLWAVRGAALPHTSVDPLQEIRCRVYARAAAASVAV